jgi:hypothetical protein
MAIGKTSSFAADERAGIQARFILALKISA